VGRAVATRTTLPITQHVLLTTDGGRLKLSATNLEIAVSTWVGAEILEEGSLTVPARLLTDFVNSLPRQPIEITTEGQAKGIALKGAKVQASINGAEADEFPPIPSVEDGVATRIGAKELREAIHQVVFAAAVEDSRPVLTGVNVELDGAKLTLAAADGFRLAVHTTQMSEPVGEKLSVIVPARTLTEVERLLEGDEPVEVLVTPQRSQILFRLKNAEIVSQLIQGNFPNYAQLIPHEHSTRVVVDLAELQRATRTASIFAKDGSGIIRIQVSPAEGGSGKLEVSSRAEELGDNTGEMEAAVEGGEGRIAFNSRYLSDVLAVMGREQVSLDMTTSSSPGVLRAVGDDKYVHVVMPMFVQW
jgi:DNA polymerase-3 subunit beta